MKHLTSNEEAFNVIRWSIWRQIMKYLTPCHEVFDAMSWSIWRHIVKYLTPYQVYDCNSAAEFRTTENYHKSCRCICSVLHHRPRKLSLLGLMAKIKCSICSYQFNIWYAGHSLAHILIWFLAFDQGSEVYLTLITGCLGIALQPSAAHF